MAEGVVDREPAVGVGDGRDVGDGPAGARGGDILLVGGPWFVRRAAASTRRPGALRPAARRVGVPGEAGAADRDDIGVGGGPVDDVGGVAGRGGHDHTGLLPGVEGRLLGVLTGYAVRVRDVLRPEGDGGAYRGAQVVGGGRVGLDEQEAAGRTGGGDGVQVESGLLGPSQVVRRVVDAAALVDLAEAAVVGRAGRQPELLPEHGEIGLRRGVAAGIHDRDGTALAAVGEVVRGADVVRSERGGRGAGGGGRRPLRGLRADQGVAAGGRGVRVGGGLIAVRGPVVGLFRGHVQRRFRGGAG